MYPKEIFITWYSLLSMAPKQITPQASPHHSTRLKQIFITSNPPQKKKNNTTKPSQKNNTKNGWSLQFMDFLNVNPNFQFFNQPPTLSFSP